MIPRLIGYLVICFGNLGLTSNILLQFINTMILLLLLRCHIDVQFFAIPGWTQYGDIIMYHIPGIINPEYDLNKLLGWVLNYRHARYLMGHYNISFR